MAAFHKETLQSCSLRAMLRLCILLLCLPWGVAALGFRQAHLESSVANVAEVKAGHGQTNTVEALRERAAKIQKELSELAPSSARDTVSPEDMVKEPAEVAFQLPDDLQSTLANQRAVHTQMSYAQQPVPPPVVPMLPLPSQRHWRHGIVSETQHLPWTELPPGGFQNKPFRLRKSANMHATSMYRGSKRDDDGAEEAVEEEEEEEKGQKAVTASEPDQITVRPSNGKGVDTIAFGVYAKTFYGVNLKTNSFTIDVVITLKWLDKRVIELIPEGMKSLTLSNADSQKKMWLPAIEITNRDIKKYDLLSTSVVVNNKGEVVKVERAIVSCKERFELSHYPFDKQDLSVKIASTKYMADEVGLRPDQRHVGKNDNLFEGDSYDFVSLVAKTTKETDAVLSKSRGTFTMKVTRNLDKYIQGHVIPASLVVMISWGVFWFPFVAPFITPRLALSVLALMSFISLSSKSSSALPDGNPFNWNDCINQTLLACIFITVVLNIYSEICMHQAKVEELARSVNHECKLILPFISISSLSIILSAAGPDGWMDLQLTVTVIKCYLFITVGSYLAWNVHRTHLAVAKQKAEGEAKATALANK